MLGCDRRIDTAHSRQSSHKLRRQGLVPRVPCDDSLIRHNLNISFWNVLSSPSTVDMTADYSTCEV